jgi:hypothetical protein
MRALGLGHGALRDLAEADEMREREIDWPKTKRAEDGSLFDIAKTKPDQIARIVLDIRSALTQAIDAAERRTCQKSKQGG